MFGWLLVMTYEAYAVLTGRAETMTHAFRRTRGRHPLTRIGIVAFWSWLTWHLMHDTAQPKSERAKLALELWDQGQVPFGTQG